MSNEWNWHVNSLQTRLNDLQSTIDSIKSCVERRPGLDAATQAIAALIEASTQSEYALQEFPTALSQILSDPAIGSLLIGPQGEIVLYNGTAEQLLGREYLSERSMSSLQFSAEDRSTRLLADDLPWNRALKGESLPDVRLHLSRPTNPDTWINVSATPFRSPSGVVTGAVVFIIDTTEEVQLEGSINTLCNTIHDQIAQVGSTHTQLRDLADRLSNVGVQRILADGSQAVPPRPEEDPTRKKSEPRRDAGLGPSAARQAALPQAAKSKNLVPPTPVKTEGTKIVSENDLAAEAEYADDDLAHSGTWAQLPKQADTVGDSDSALTSSSDAESVVIPEGSKTLEVERVEVDRQDAVIEQTEQFPTEQSIENIQEVPLTDDQNATAEFIDMSAHFNESELLSEESGEVEAVSSSEVSSPAEDSVLFDAVEVPASQTEDDGISSPESEGWTSTPAETDAASNDQVADSAKSLFGKFANLTKDSYSEAKSDEREPDPALPWPELVDAPDYGEPLWDEYNQSEEEATPWQKDRVGEESAFGLPPVDLNADTEQAAATEEEQEVHSEAEPQETYETDPDYVESEYAEAHEHEHEYIQQEDAGEALTEEPAIDESVTYAETGESEHLSEEEPYAVAGEADAVQETIEFEQAENEVAAAFDDVDAEVEADDFTPVEPVAETEEAIEVVMEEASPPSTATDTTDKADALGTGNRLSALKDRKPRASASYNRLQPLSAAGELDEDDDGFLNEGLVKFSADELAPVDEGPKRVLVVDDIPVNQKLLLLHLKRLGYEADVASNGQEALDMLAEKAYELILMDCDMPVMSGFEAASRIRSNEAYSHRRIPIIALTSYDREGDKEKCIASGMDDYITKGASQKELKETIERSIVSARMKDETLGAGESEDESDGAPLDITAMLKLYGREEVEEISRLFLSNMGTYIECMQLAIDNKDADSVAHFANAVKGPCAALGMRLMTRLTSDIMAYAESQDWTQVRVKYMRLKAVFVQTREELKKVCPDDSLLAT